MIGDEKNSPNSTCEVCGDEFSCGAQKGECWCFAIYISKVDLEKLKGDFKNCLCQKCLTASETRQAFHE